MSTRDDRSGSRNEGKGGAGLTRHAAYNPKELLILGQALDLVVASIPLGYRTSEVKARLAERILAKAAMGEHDPLQLRGAALLDFDFEPRFKHQTSRSWTYEDDQKLLAFLSKGFSAPRAAAALKRTVGSVQTRARALGKPFPSLRSRRRRLELPAR